MKSPYQLDAFLVDAGKRTALSVRISEPEKAKDGEEYFCRVNAPTLFSSEKKIFGANEAQACELAQQFVKSMLKGKKLVDDKGRDVNL